MYASLLQGLLTAGLAWLVLGPFRKTRLCAVMGLGLFRKIGLCKVLWFRVWVGGVKNAPDYDSASCEIRVCVHAVLKCTDYPIKSVGLRMHRTMIVQGARLGFACTPY
jgi:hypothetical protein